MTSRSRISLQTGALRSCTESRIPYAVERPRKHCRQRCLFGGTYEARAIDSSLFRVTASIELEYAQACRDSVTVLVDRVALKAGGDRKVF